MLPVNIQVTQTTNIKTGLNQFNFISKQNYIIFQYLDQCLGSGSARFWLPGSGSAEIYRSPDPRSKISTKNGKKKTFYSQNPNLNCLNKRDSEKFPDL